MNLLVIDGQGGGLGKQLITALKEHNPSFTIHAVGTNSAATGTMLRAGADDAATGENAVIVGCRKANIIIGPIGIVIADSLLGEITPAIAVAVGQSHAKRILVPLNHCDNIIAGISNIQISNLIQCVVREVDKLT